MHTQSREIAHDSTLAARGPAAPGWLWPAAGCGIVVLLLGLGALLDQIDSEREVAVQAAFADGRRAGQADMINSTETAWKLAEAEAARCAARKARP